ncbi:DegV family protein [Paenibacillus lutrae]|uniref:DegV family EDD domain-containing protein n=1 Tax=Paenibacillus lutrae TaxID=2078573 RepID=A0A7X3K1R1_9BACL|nr:DegV family EDD domain-containing protein [Paenibacillus lutrae]
MAPIKIFTDSTNDLNQKYLDENEIGVVPLYVIFGEDSYRDGVDITTEELYRKVEQTGKLPKTAAPSPADFDRAFRPFIEQGYDIVYIGLSSEMSSTYQNAKLAAELLEEDRITIIDSRNLATGIGILVCKAVEAVKQGQSPAEIEALIYSCIPRVSTEFIIDTLDYLHKGGRCSGVQAFFGSLLKIRPVVQVKEGKMILTSKVRGKREKALEQLINNTLDFKHAMDPDVLFVTHSMAREEAELVRKQLLEQTGVKRVEITETGCVVSSHCGPQTVGIVYIKS